MVEFNVKYSLFSSSFFLYLLGTTMARNLQYNKINTKVNFEFAKCNIHFFF